jgi:hypothetical protein
MKRRIRAVALLSLALLVGASCSNPSLGVDLPATPETTVPLDDGVYTYPAVANVEVTDGAAPHCSLLMIGDVARTSCFEDRLLPAVALTDAATRILVVAVNADEFVTFVDGIRVVSRSSRFVAAQMSTGMPLEDLSFTVAAIDGMTWCDMSHDRLVICNGIHHNG